ncbi:MAG: polysaccharide biosynthesis protein [Sphingobacteriaceae bacterium]|nr:polysaccharide biosynthesis protein [Sphingobacteriaceae bacterium]
MGVIKQQTIKGTIYSYAGILIGFITIVLLQPHALTTEQVGLTQLLISFSGLFGQFASLGFPGTARYFPYFRNQEKGHHGYLFLFCIVALAGTLLMIILAWAFKDQIISSKSGESSLFGQYYWYLLPLIVFTTFFNVFERYAMMLYNTSSGRILREFTKRIFILVPVLLFYFQLISFELFMILWLVANVLPTLLMLRRLIADGHFFFKPDFKFLDGGMRSKLINISAWGLFVGSSPLIIESIDKYIIHKQFGLDATGIYSIAFQFAIIVSLPSRSLYSIAFAVVAEAWKENDLKTIRDVYAKSCIVQIITTLLLVILVWANINNIFQILPANYESGKYVILFICLAHLVDASTGINTAILASSKFYKYDGIFTLSLAGLTILTNIWLIPIFGITGSAIAMFITIAAINIFRYLFLLFAFKLQPFTIKSPIALLVGILIYFLSLWLIPKFDNFVVDIVVRSGFITAFYGGCVYSLKLSDDITHTIDGYLQKMKALF